MERLTIWADMGFDDWEEIYYKVSSDPEGAYDILDLANLYGQYADAESANILQDISVKLKAYEDIGLTPEQLLEIDKMYYDKCEEVSELKKQLKVSREGELINRKALLDILNQSFQNINYHPDFGDPAVGMEQELFNEFLHDMIKLVEKQPTAYDVEKVVEQLEDYLFDKYCVEGDGKISEILKEGGANE
jgi:hypothetical protein